MACISMFFIKCRRALVWVLFCGLAKKFRTSRSGAYTNVWRIFLVSWWITLQSELLNRWLVGVPTMPKHSVCRSVFVADGFSCNASFTPANGHLYVGNQAQSLFVPGHLQCCFSCSLSKLSIYWNNFRSHRIAFRCPEWAFHNHLALSSWVQSFYWQWSEVLEHLSLSSSCERGARGVRAFSLFEILETGVWYMEGCLSDWFFISSSFCV